VDEDMTAALRELLDKYQIHETLMRYCRAVDRGDRDLLASCFHPDAFDDHGYFTAHGSEIADVIIAKIQEFSVASMHFVGNELIEVKGDSAFSEAYFFACLVVPLEGDEQATRIRAARYIDIFERRSGHWKIAKRTVVDEYDRIDRVVELTPGREFFHRGLRSPEDLIYHVQSLVE